MRIDVTARRAGPDDLSVLVDLYRALEAEMVALHLMWPRADGLAAPVEDSIAKLLTDEETRVYLGEIDGYPLGFITGRAEAVVEDGTEVVVIRLVFVDEEARAVGVGEVMRDLLMDEYRAEGHTLFDAHVLPGHRLAKNFFESGGFSARSIVMHHDDARER